MLPRDVDGKAAEGLPPVHQGKAAAKAVLLLDFGGPEVAGLPPAEGELFRSVRRLHGPDGVGVAAVIEHPPGHPGKAGEGAHGVFHRAEVIQVVVVDVQHHGGIRVGGKEGVPELAGLVDKEAAFSRPAVAADGPQLAADDGGGVRPRPVENLGEHGGDGGLPVGAADAHRFLIVAGKGPQHPGPLPQGEAQLPGGCKLRVVLHNGGGIEDQLGPLEIFRGMAQGDGYPQLPFHGQDIAFVVVAARDNIPLA